MKHDHTQFSSAASAYGAADQATVEDRIKRFVPLVRKSAWHIYGGGREGLEVDDLMQAGMIALTEAAQRHSGPGEDGFAAYAKLRVRGAMFDYIRKLLPDSRTTARRRKRIGDARDKLRALLGRAPEMIELCAETGFAAEEIAAIEDGQVHVVQLEDSYDESDAAFRDERPDAFALLSQMQDGERLLAAMERLGDRLKLVLQLYFVEELNLKEIAAVLDVSVPRIHQLKAQALGKLKAEMEESGP